jgi:hypothetical protein
VSGLLTLRPAAQVAAQPADRGQLALRAPAGFPFSFFRFLFGEVPRGFCDPSCSAMRSFRRTFDAFTFTPYSSLSFTFQMLLVVPYTFLVNIFEIIPLLYSLLVYNLKLGQQLM